MNRKSKGIIAITAAVAAVIVVVVAAVLITRGGSRGEYREHLELGSRYLEELEYEQAIVELRAAIEIEPNDSEAYLILSEVYVAMGDYENAIAVLEEGYAATGDEFFTERMTAVETQKQEQEQREYEQAERDREERIEQFFEEYADLYDRVREVHSRTMGPYDGNYLTHAQRETAYRGLAEELQQYLDDVFSIDGLPDEIYGENSVFYTNDKVFFCCVDAYENLAELYLYLNDLEKCFQVRTGWAEYSGRPDLVQDGNHGYWSGEDTIYDKYGRETNWKYGENGTGESAYDEHQYGCTYYCTRKPDDRTFECTYTYDAEGRVSTEQIVITEWDGRLFSHDEIVYTYTGDYSCTIDETHTIRTTTGTMSTSESRYEVFYDEYGWETSRESVF